MTVTRQDRNFNKREKHYVDRVGWLRAAVLGANDGLLSTSSLMVGVAAAASSPSQLILTGVAGIAAGAMSMATGEFVSVSSQFDSEKADLRREKRELRANPGHEMRELAAIYMQRGLAEPLAVEVAEALHAHDALDAHARDELGITDRSTANPLQAAVASAASFTAGGLPPLVVALVVAPAMALPSIVIIALLALIALGALGARAGGAPIMAGMARVVLLGSIAMAVTAIVGHFFHQAPG